MTILFLGFARFPGNMLDSCYIDSTFTTEKQSTLSTVLCFSYFSSKKDYTPYSRPSISKSLFEIIQDIGQVFTHVTCKQTNIRSCFTPMIRARPVTVNSIRHGRFLIFIERNKRKNHPC